MLEEARRGRTGSDPASPCGGGILCGPLIRRLRRHLLPQGEKGEGQASPPPNVRQAATSSRRLRPSRPQRPCQAPPSPLVPLWRRWPSEARSDEGLQEARRGRTGSDPASPCGGGILCGPLIRRLRRHLLPQGEKGEPGIAAAENPQADDQRKADPSFLAEAVVIRNQQMQRRLVLFDGGKAADRIGENIIGQIVIDGRDLADQNVAALAPEGMPDAR